MDEFNFNAPQYFPVVEDDFIWGQVFENYFGANENNINVIEVSSSKPQHVNNTDGSENQGAISLNTKPKVANNERKQQKPYVSLAEAVAKFQTGTPPRFHSRSNKDVNVTKKEITKPTKTIVQPFTFEERDKQMMKKKDEKLKIVLEHEKQARIFHANKVPQYLQLLSTTTTGTSSSSNSVKSAASKENLNECKQFKAQPATVLYKQPFKPKHEKILTEIHPFNLDSDKRAIKRKEFDAKMKEKELLMTTSIKQMEEKRLMMEEQQRVMLRKQAEHKANPIRTYKPVPKISPLPLTDPQTPNFKKPTSKFN